MMMVRLCRGWGACVGGVREGGGGDLRSPVTVLYETENSKQTCIHEQQGSILKD